MSTISYRPEVDGLRAIAVLLVIFFHLNETLIPSGFIGVDIFFVISGYVITLNIFSDIINEKFHFISFYEKRIKRILPLAFSVLALSSVLAFILFTPIDLVSYSNSLRYSAGFFSNVYFETATGYFANSTMTMPLLHFWSLSIEEQFYIFYPILLIFLFKFLSRNTILFAIFSIIIFSFLYSWYLTNADQDAAYFSLLTRGGELMLGGWVALISIRKRIVSLSLFSSYCFAAIGISLFSYCLVTINKNIVFPGIDAYLVTIATGFILLGSRHTRSPLHKALSCRPMSAIGKHSFSLYLWHWPIQCFYQYYYGVLTTKGIIICLALTGLLAVISKRLIEDPFRYANIKTVWVYLGYFLIPLICFFSIAKFTKKEDGFPRRFDVDAQQYFQEVKAEFVSNKKNHSLDGINPEVIGNEFRKDINAILWGDSHAKHFTGFIDRLGKRTNLSILQDGSSGCPPITNIQLITHGKIRDDCHQKNEQMFNSILDSKVNVVFLGGRWAYYVETKAQQNERLVAPFLIDELDDTLSKDNTQRAFKLRLTNMIEELFNAGIQPVILEQVPDHSFNPADCVFKTNIFESFINNDCHGDKAAFNQRYKKTKEIFETLRKKFPQLLFIDMKPLLEDGEKYITNKNSMSFYSDDDHINLHGASYLFEEFEKTPEYIKIIEKIKQTN